MSAWKFQTYARIGLSLGISDSRLQVKVCERDGYLCVQDENGEHRLDEYRPGLFFSKDGDCLDFRGSMPTWTSYRMKKN
jgi:hypothetical protein